MAVEHISGALSPEPIEEKPHPMVTITNKKHVHASESGWLDEGLKNEKQGMTYLKLSNCEHGKNGCWVKPDDYVTADQKARRRYSKAMPQRAKRLKTTIVDVAPPPEPTAPLEVLTEQDLAIQKLSDCFKIGFNITEACADAGISRDTYYRWLDENPGLSDKFEWDRGELNRLARQGAVTGLKSGDLPTIRWWLDRRDPDFRPKAEVDNKFELVETRKKIKDFLDDDDRRNEERTESTSTPAIAAGAQVAEPPTDIS